MVYAVRSSDVRTVLVDGEIVVEDRELKTMDLADIMEEATKAKEDLLSRLEEGKT